MSDRNLNPVMQAALEPFMPTVALASIAADHLASNACREAPEDLRGLSSSALRWLGEQAAIAGDGEVSERVAAEAVRRAPRPRVVLMGRAEAYIANLSEADRERITSVFGSVEAYAKAMGSPAPRGTMRAAYDHYRGR